MLFNYHRKIRLIAQAYILRDVDVPLNKLGIADGERLYSIHSPLVVQKQVRQVEREDIERDEQIAGRTTFTAEDFPKLGYIGSGRGGNGGF